jgi:hypothetical protein
MTHQLALDTLREELRQATTALRIAERQWEVRLAESEAVATKLRVQLLQERDAHRHTAVELEAAKASALDVARNRESNSLAHVQLRDELAATQLALEMVKAEAAHERGEAARWRQSWEQSREELRQLRGASSQRGRAASPGRAGGAALSATPQRPDVYFQQPHVLSRASALAAPLVAGGGGGGQAPVARLPLAALHPLPAAATANAYVSASDRVTAYALQQSSANSSFSSSLPFEARAQMAAAVAAPPKPATAPSGRRRNSSSGGGSESAGGHSRSLAASAAAVEGAGSPPSVLEAEHEIPALDSSAARRASLAHLLAYHPPRPDQIVLPPPLPSRSRDALPERSPPMGRGATDMRQVDLDAAAADLSLLNVSEASSPSPRRDGSGGGGGGVAAADPALSCAFARGYAEGAAWHSGVSLPLPPPPPSAAARRLAPPPSAVTVSASVKQSSSGSRGASGAAASAVDHRKATGTDSRKGSPSRPRLEQQPPTRSLEADRTSDRSSVASDAAVAAARAQLAQQLQHGPGRYPEAAAAAAATAVVSHAQTAETQLDTAGGHSQAGVPVKSGPGRGRLPPDLYALGAMGVAASEAALILSRPVSASSQQRHQQQQEARPRPRSASSTNSRSAGSEAGAGGRPPLHSLAASGAATASHLATAAPSAASSAAAGGQVQLRRSAAPTPRHMKVQPLAPPTAAAAAALWQASPARAARA